MDDDAHHRVRSTIGNEAQARVARLALHQCHDSRRLLPMIVSPSLSPTRRRVVTTTDRWMMRLPWKR